jgi:hypothetical protein
MAPFWTSVFQVCTYATQLAGCAFQRAQSRPALRARSVQASAGQSKDRCSLTPTISGGGECARPARQRELSKFECPEHGEELHVGITGPRDAKAVRGCPRRQSNIHAANGRGNCKVYLGYLPRAPQRCDTVRPARVMNPLNRPATAASASTLVDQMRASQPTRRRNVCGASCLAINDILHRISPCRETRNRTTRCSRG